LSSHHPNDHLNDGLSFTHVYHHIHHHDPADACPTLLGPLL
jgi:hypothetical protein